MHLDLNVINKEKFSIRSKEIGGEEFTLITPLKSGSGAIEWSQETLFFRSAIVDKNGEVVSLGFPKFFNSGEREDLFPSPQDLTGCEVIEKMDGTLLTATVINDVVVIRTRGTFSAYEQPNGQEIDVLKAKYPKVWACFRSHFSLIFEWVTPTNRIVCDYGKEPDLYLIGGIYHESGKIFRQSELDFLSRAMGVKRPRTFQFNSAVELVEQVKGWTDGEGVVVYSNHGQTIHKYKSVKYLEHHYMMSQVRSIRAIADFYFKWLPKNREEFVNKLVEQFDYEVAVTASDNIDKLYSRLAAVQAVYEKARCIMATQKGKARKDVASFVQTDPWCKEHKQYCFLAFEDKPLPQETLRRKVLQ